MAQTTTKAQTQAQLDAANASLQSWNNILSGLGSINPATQQVEKPSADTYFRDTKDTELKDKAVESYDTLYNDEFNKTKNIQFTVGNEKQSTDTSAFYTYNAAFEADKKVSSTLSDEAAAHQAYLTQQKNINDYIATKNETAESKAFDYYMNQQLATASPYLAQGYVTQNDPFFNRNDYNKAPSRKQVPITVMDPNGQSHVRYILAYKDDTAVSKQRDLDKTIYMDSYNKDPNIRKKALADYTKYVNDQVAASTKSISTLTKTLNSLK
jgi:hypothetical protein